jgi:hypothetical protein
LRENNVILAEKAVWSLTGTVCPRLTNFFYVCNRNDTPFSEWRRPRYLKSRTCPKVLTTSAISTAPGREISRNRRSLSIRKGHCPTGGWKSWCYRLSAVALDLGIRSFSARRSDRVDAWTGHPLCPPRRQRVVLESLFSASPPCRSKAMFAPLGCDFPIEIGEPSNQLHSQPSRTFPLFHEDRCRLGLQR